MEFGPIPAPIVAIGAILFVLVLVLMGILRQRQRLPYQRRESLFSDAEKRFLLVLQQAALDYHVYGKVRLADIVQVKQGLAGRRFFQAFNRIACKHVDYVLCDKNSYAILCVIELDDASHQRPERRRRDQFVDTVMQAAGIPILHFPVRRNYQINAIKQRLQSVL